MKVMVAILCAFLVIGIFTRTYNNWTRLLLLGVICAVVLYVTLL